MKEEIQNNQIDEKNNSIEETENEQEAIEKKTETVDDNEDELSVIIVNDASTEQKPEFVLNLKNLK